ncbi:YggT family protein [Streptococcus pacificus]|uniref:YggT family protein n=1 Tax=Streptococcus pacificus TaxID=2740577 RepID=A0ABS0ZJ13_9STRE|nr:YggT family protein [Streptococcus pacificus]MBJ8326006.1 YggT family protein [Streptococcus pacificus]
MILFIINNAIDIFSFLLVVYALLSWFPEAHNSPWSGYLYQIVEPILKVFRKFNLQFGTIDFTVVAALIALRILKNVINMIL